MSMEGSIWSGNTRARLIGIIASAVVMVEGLALVFLASPTVIEGIGRILERTVLIGGAQLFVLGALLFLYWTMGHRRLGGRTLFERRSFSTIAFLATSVIALEGVVLPFMAGDFSMESAGTFHKFWMVGGGSQLFLLGYFLLYAWISHRDQKVNWAHIVSALSGGAIAAEGLFIIGNAAPVVIEDIGGVQSQTISLIGVQLFILGLLISFFWTFRHRKLLGKYSLKEGLLDSAPLLLSEVVAMEGLIVAIYSFPLEVSGLGAIREFWMAAAGVQLLVLASLPIIAWFWRESDLWGTSVSEVAAALAGVVVLAEGLFIMTVAAPFSVEGIGGMLSRTMFVAGAQLLVLGLVVVVYQLWRTKVRRKEGLLNNRFVRLLPLLVGVIVAVEGLVMIAYKGTVDLEGVGTIRDAWMVLAGGQLLLLGGLISMAWYWHHREVRVNITRLAGPMLALIFITEGLVLAGAAANVRIDGFGGVGSGWITAVGAQMMVLGALIIAMRWLDIGPLNTEVLGVKLSDGIEYLAGVVLAIEGLVLASISGDILIEGFGGLSGKYVAVAGGQIVFLAFAFLIFWVLRNRELPLHKRKAALWGAIFLLLMLPPAILF